MCWRRMPGVYEFAAFGEITGEHFDKTFNTNVRGLSFAVQKALPLLAKGSSVILIGSMVSIKGFASCSVYDATKAAIRSFARGWIVDLKGRDIRVNVWSPGYTATPGLAHFLTGSTTGRGRRFRSARPDRHAGRSRQGGGIPGVRRQRLHYRDRAVRRWRCGPDLSRIQP